MKALNKLERKYGKYSIKNLPILMAAVIGIGYFFSMFAPEFTMKLIFIPYSVLVEHEYWRLFTWVLTPAGTVDFVNVMMLFFLVLFGKYIEAGMGTFLFNLYVLGIWLWNTVVMMGISLYGYFTYSAELFPVFGISQTAIHAMFYFDFGIFLAFALMYSDTMVLFMFVLPLKTSWVAYINMAFLAFYFVKGSMMDRANIIAYLANFFVFYLLIGRGKGLRKSTSPAARKREERERQLRWQERLRQGDESMNDKRIKRMTPVKEVSHKCAICGRTPADDPTLEFRYCSKCKGNHEYCNEHLFTHEHITGE